MLLPLLLLLRLLMLLLLLQKALLGCFSFKRQAPPRNHAQNQVN